MTLSRLLTLAEMRLILITLLYCLIKLSQEMSAIPPVVQVSNTKQQYKQRMHCVYYNKVMLRV